MEDSPILEALRQGEELGELLAGGDLLTSINELRTRQRVAPLEEGMLTEAEMIAELEWLRSRSVDRSLQTSIQHPASGERRGPPRRSPGLPVTPPPEVTGRLLLGEADGRMRLKSDFAILDVRAGRAALRRHFADAPLVGDCPEHLRVPVVIRGYIDGVHGDDDGVSREFTVRVESVGTPE